MSRKRQKTQLELAFTWGAEGEARSEPTEGIELPVAESETERPIELEGMMEEVCEKKNLKRALRRVKSNRGAPGIDGMTVADVAPPVPAGPVISPDISSAVVPAA